ncbi:hypothetical protein [Halobaculum rubrum]|uniref:hypothetical protein n=1 Tax=Halobaculum rubrum TaxID=2872158 RepID=UPI001CA3A451|nr:hypothetical protein [Halobaculum rubrum]QZY01173.1 hypothetical protein K6T25_15400 [Halobaculum rubrum]
MDWTRELFDYVLIHSHKTSDGRWEWLGENTVRDNKDGYFISLPADPGGVEELIFSAPENAELAGYWSWDRAAGWILLSEQQLRHGDEHNGDLISAYPPKYDLRNGGRIEIPDMLFAGSDDPQSDFDQRVPSHVAMNAGETRHFFTWSEWGESGPNAMVLLSMKDLDIPGPSGQGMTFGSSGPRFGGDSVADILPDPHFELEAANS